MGHDLLLCRSTVYDSLATMVVGGGSLGSGYGHVPWHIYIPTKVIILPLYKSREVPSGTRTSSKANAHKSFDTNSWTCLLPSRWARVMSEVPS
jgi:hypothetical protein